MLRFMVQALQDLRYVAAPKKYKDDMSFAILCGSKEKMKRIMYSGPSFYLIKFKISTQWPFFPFVCIYIPLTLIKFYAQ